MDIKTWMTPEYLSKLLEYGHHVSMKTIHDYWIVFSIYSAECGKFSWYCLADNIEQSYNLGSNGRLYFYEDILENFTWEYVICKPPVKEWKRGDKCMVIWEDEVYEVDMVLDGVLDISPLNPARYDSKVLTSKCIPLPDEPEDEYITVEYQGNKIRAKVCE